MRRGKRIPGTAQSRMSHAPPDLIDQAKDNLGIGADPASITDALFDAAFRALKAVPVEHPARWAMVVGYWEKMTALYESIDDGATGGDGLIIPQRPVHAGKPKEPAMHNRPGLAKPEPWRPQR